MRYLKKEKSFTLIELMISVMIIATLAAGIVPMYITYLESKQLESGVQKLFFDLLEAQEYSMANKGGFSFYGVTLFSAGAGGWPLTTDGYKLICFDTPSAIIKSSVATDNPQMAEDTVFGENIRIAAGSELGSGQNIIFKDDGMPTTDGTTLLTYANNEITLQNTRSGSTMTINISPKTARLFIYSGNGLGAGG